MERSHRFCIRQITGRGISDTRTPTSFRMSWVEQTGNASFLEPDHRKINTFPEIKNI